jgi:hypothetical protein
MDGLLDFVKTPEGQGLLAAAFGGLAGARRGQPLNSIGRAGLAGLQGYGNAQERIGQEEEKAMQRKMQGFQMSELERKQQEAAQSAQTKQAQQEWLAQQNPSMKEGDQPDPYKQQLWEFANKGLIPVSDYISALKPKAPERKVVGNTLLELGDNGIKELYKPEEKVNPNQPFMMVDGKVTPNAAYQQYEMNKAATGAARISQSVNTGQKGFDNTLKLRGDFRSEPIYKAHQDVQSAHSQISSALKQASPAGDLAGATKLMKILDPGSVVRESELGMAMAASGALDRLQNYASNVMNGTKLTPTQRKDFQTLADSLYSESVKQYNSKRSEYQGIAERNQLSVPDVLGPELGGSKPVDAPSMSPGSKPTMKFNPQTGKLEQVR